MPDRSPEAAFEALAGELLARPDVDAGTGFGGSPGVRVGGRIFAEAYAYVGGRSGASG